MTYTTENCLFPLILVYSHSSLCVRRVVPISTRQNINKLRTSKYINTYRFTMKGCRISCNIFFSFFTCSTCFNLMTSARARTFRAPYSCVDLLRQRNTRPNEPVPVN